MIRTILQYQKRDGSAPFREWLLKLQDVQARARIRARLDRLRLGNFGDSKRVGNGMFELRFHFGPGYRVYFGRIADKIVVLLLGGDKGSQEKDIKKAKEYWHDYLNYYEKKKIQKISRRTH